MTSDRPRRKSPAGQPTTDLVTSVTVGSSADIFPGILKLYVPLGSRVADTTYGGGVFWRNVPPDAYRVYASDAAHGVDARRLPYESGYLDAVVFDPPWIADAETTYRSGDGTDAYETYYRNTQRDDPEELNGAEAILDLYVSAAAEAARVLRPGGVYIVKCQDQVRANRQWLLHVELLVALAHLGFETEDLFVLVRPNQPGVSRIVTQVHARKAHSFFLVFRRLAEGKDPRPRTRACNRAHAETD